jgi:inner membrane protein
MDNLTHSLAGWVLAETGLKRRTRKGLPALILAANMPDIDVFFGWAPWAPLAMHRGFTHGLVGGVLVLPPVLAGLLWLLDRWQLRRGKGFELPMHFGWLVALCYLGAVTHPLLDMQNTYSVQLLSPLSDRWFHTDGLFILSPLLDVMLIVGIWLSRRRWKRGRAHAGSPALIGAGAAVAFILANIGISAMAVRALRHGTPAANPDRVFAGPEPIAFWRREVIWRENGMIGAGRFDPFGAGSITGRLPPFADNMNEPVVRRGIAASSEIRDFLDWSQLPIAQVKREGCAVTVNFGDARYSRSPVAGSFRHTVTIPAEALGCPSN